MASFLWRLSRLPLYLSIRGREIGDVVYLLTYYIHHIYISSP